MANYSYVAVDPCGSEQRGSLDVSDQHEALRRIKEMGLFPTKVLPVLRGGAPRRGLASRRGPASRLGQRLFSSVGGRVKPMALAVFTRQLATLLQAGMPLLRGLRTLEEQAENRNLKPVIAALSASIERGDPLTDALRAHPKVFNRLYVNMARAGEIGGALDVTLRRLAEFLEKAERIKGKVKAALYYPCSVLLVAMAIMTLLLVHIVPKFQEIFSGLGGGIKMPAFTLLLFNISQGIREHGGAVLLALVALIVLLGLGIKTSPGRWLLDRCKLSMPILGPVFRKSAIARFSRTLGTLVSSGVPILQALTIVKETAGNVVVGRVVAQLHDHVKEGDPLAPTLKSSGVFPAMVAGMVDVGEQTGALPEMLITVADTYDDEVDNSVAAMTSLIEPIMIVFLAIIVGSIVIALFMPLVSIIMNYDSSSGSNPATD
ncbi:MAG TPA: type II secretion system F family protein [Clostridia bacterium]|nr:type II secretion system F family protein [Clostridia bacterium]